MPDKIIHKIIQPLPPGTNSLDKLVLCWGETGKPQGWDLPVLVNHDINLVNCLRCWDIWRSMWR